MIELRHIAIELNKVQVLRDVNLTIETGETIAIVGKSGCGKSVTIKIIIGLMKPDSGQVIIDGEDITHYTDKQLFPIRIRFGMLFQMAALFDSMTVGDNVGLGLKELTNLADEEIAHRVAEKLSLMGMSGTEHYMPSELSGGMKKRVGLARALVTEPEIIIYDEPTTGLDPIMAATINQIIYDLKSELSMTSIVITHDLNTVERVADRVALLDDGVIRFIGSFGEFKESSVPVIRQFLEGRIDEPVLPEDTALERSGNG